MKIAFHLQPTCGHPNYEWFHKVFDLPFLPVSGLMFFQEAELFSEDGYPILDGEWIEWHEGAPDALCVYLGSGEQEFQWAPFAEIKGQFLAAGWVEGHYFNAPQLLVKSLAGFKFKPTPEFPKVDGFRAVIERHGTDAIEFLNATRVQSFAAASLPAQEAA